MCAESLVLRQIESQLVMFLRTLFIRGFVAVGIFAVVKRKVYGMSIEKAPAIGQGRNLPIEALGPSALAMKDGKYLNGGLGFDAVGHNEGGVDND